MINHKLRFVLLVFSLLVTQTALSASTDFLFVPSNGKVTFLAVGHPSAIKIRGEGTGAEGTLTNTKSGTNGTLKFSIASLTTGIDMRDHHMKEKYLESEKYPTAELQLVDLKISDGTDVKDQSFSGSLVLKGIKKPVAGKFSAARNGNKEEVTASFPIKLTDFKIEIPSYMGIKVAEDVTVEVTSQTERQERQ